MICSMSQVSLSASRRSRCSSRQITSLAPSTYFVEQPILERKTLVGTIAAPAFRSPNRSG